MAAHTEAVDGLLSQKLGLIEGIVGDSEVPLHAAHRLITAHGIGRSLGEPVVLKVSKEPWNKLTAAMEPRVLFHELEHLLEWGESPPSFIALAEWKDLSTARGFFSTAPPPAEPLVQLERSLTAGATHHSTSPAGTGSTHSPSGARKSKLSKQASAMADERTDAAKSAQMSMAHSRVHWGWFSTDEAHGMCRLAVQNRTAQTNARARQLESSGVESWTSPLKRSGPAKGATGEGIEIGGTIVVDPEDVLTPRKKVMLVDLHQSPKAKTIRFQTLNTGFSTAVVLLVRAVGETGVALEPTIVKIDVRKELESEIQLHEQMQKHLGFNMPQLLAVTDSAERELIGYKQSFAGACWQMPELASVGGDLAVPLERLIRQELVRDAVDGVSSFSLGDVSVSRVLDTLMGDIVLQLCRRTALRCDAPLLEPILGTKTRGHIETIRDMTTGSDRATFEELLSLLDNASSRLPFESGHEPIRAMCHGDLHGGNVMIDSRGNPWLIDCGMSKPADKGYPLMDAAKLECCFLFAYVLAPLTVEHIKDAEPNHLVDWLSLGRKDAALLQTIAAGCATKEELLEKLASESMLAQVKVRLEEPDLCDEWLEMAAGRLDELMNVDELTECMRRTDYLNPARRRPPGLATQLDRLTKYRKSLDVADGFAGKIRRYISALSTCLKEDVKARGSLDSHVLNLAMHLLFYSIRFTTRGYPTSSPMHKRLAQHVSARLARVVIDAATAQSSEARPAVATIVQPAPYVQYEHGQVLQVWGNGRDGTAMVEDGEGGQLVRMGGEEAAPLARFLETQLPLAAPVFKYNLGTKLIVDGTSVLIVEREGLANSYTCTASSGGSERQKVHLTPSNHTLEHADPSGLLTMHTRVAWSSLELELGDGAFASLGEAAEPTANAAVRVKLDDLLRTGDARHEHKGRYEPRMGEELGGGDEGGGEGGGGAGGGLGGGGDGGGLGGGGDGGGDGGGGGALITNARAPAYSSAWLKGWVMKHDGAQARTCTVAVPIYADGQLVLLDGEVGTLQSDAMGLNLCRWDLDTKRIEPRRILAVAGGTPLPTSVRPTALLTYKAGQWIRLKDGASSRPSEANLENAWRLAQLQPHGQPDARGCSVVVVRDQGSFCLLAANHSPCVDRNMDHAIDFCSYQALVRTALGTIIDVLSAQRLDLMLQCVNLKVKGNNTDAFTTIMEEVKTQAPKGRPPAILIRAEAAGGKTTFSKRFVLLCTIEQWGRHVATPTPHPVFYVPVLVFVVDLVKVLKKQRGAGGGNLLLIHLQSQLGAHTRHCEQIRP